jgi:hypothetical protein
MANSETEIKPIEHVKIDKRKPKGYKIFDKTYPNIFLCAKKKSGKTTVINHYLKHCIGPETKVIIYCPTVDKDPGYLGICKMLDKKNIEYEKYYNFKEDGVNHLQDLLNELSEDNKDDDAPAGLIPVTRFLDPCTKMTIYEEPTKAKTKMVKSKYVTPEYVFIFDDLGTDMRDKSIGALCKKNRHYKCTAIFSAQYPTDLHPEAIKQTDYALLFGRIPLEKIEKIHKMLNVKMDVEELTRLYELVTQEPYAFLNIDVIDDVYKKRFGI